MASNITAVVNRQVLKWERESRAAGSALRQQIERRPMVTVSSAFGSEGWSVGRIVAQRLEYDFFDRELVEKIAASANVRQRLVESLDERAQDWITEHITRQFEKEVFTSGDFLRHLCRVTLTIAQHGAAVLVGRGGQFILDAGSTLRVRTTAPLEARVKRTAEADGLEPLDARARVLRKDAERASFTVLHFNRSVDDPAHYDLVINMSTLDAEQAAALVLRAFELRFGSG